MRGNCILRVTAVPRDASPGAAYHPIYFANKFNDKVIAIPGKGEALDESYLSFSESIFNIFSLKIQKIIFLFELLFLSLFKSFHVKHIFVHSFIYAIPFLIIGKKVTLVIHGSDYKYLYSKIGRILINRLNSIYVVGKSDVAKEVGIKSIPNIFKCVDNLSNASEEKMYDFCFILRNAPVKNPQFPQKLYESIPDCKSIRIAVIGIEGTKKLEENKSIEFYGVLPPVKVHELLQKSSVFILPSFNEGVPKALFEALSNGCACIVNDGIEIPQEIENFISRVDCVNPPLFENFEKVLLSDSQLGQESVRQYLSDSERVLSEIYSLRSL